MSQRRPKQEYQPGVFHTARILLSRSIYLIHAAIGVYTQVFWNDLQLQVLVNLIRVVNPLFPVFGLQVIKIAPTD